MSDGRAVIVGEGQASGRAALSLCERGFQAEWSFEGDAIVQPSEAGGFAAFHVQGRHSSGRLVLDNPKLAALVRRAIRFGAEVDPAAFADPASDPPSIFR